MTFANILGRSDGASGRDRRARVRLVFAISVSAAAALFIGASWWRLIKEASTARKPDVLLIVLDSVRADRLSCYGCPRKTSPYIDSLADDGLLFLNNKSQSGGTAASMVSLFKAAYATESAVGDKEDSRDFVFAEVMKRDGYRTVAVQGSPLLAREGRFARGFDDYSLMAQPASSTQDDAVLSTHQATLDDEQVDADAIFDKCAEALATEPQTPLFLYVHFTDAMAPYAPPGEYQTFGETVLSQNDASALSAKWLACAREGRFDECKPIAANVLALYDAEISRIDSAVGSIIAILKSQGRYDNAVIVIAADHGEGFLEHGRAGSSNSLYEELLHTPLVMKLPNHKNRVYAGLTRNVDIAPTVFAAAGINPGWGPRDGMSLIGVLAGDAPILESAAHLGDPARDGTQRFASLQYGSWKYLRFTDENGAISEAVYDLRSDPGETANLSEARAETMHAMAAKLDGSGGTPPVSQDASAGKETSAPLTPLGSIR